MLIRCGRDDGQLTLLVIGFVAIAAALVVVAVDASTTFLARRALSSAADAAALAGAQAVDREAVYAGAVGCGELLPLDPAEADRRVATSVADQSEALGHVFAAVEPPDISVADGVVTVHLSGRVAVPFGRVLAMLVPGHDDGRVQVDATSHARSPLTAPGGC
jgi:uncharacterized membrane protein